MRRWIPSLLLLTLPCTAAARVVISELMWSGTDLSTADEWIELANTGSGTVNLSGWALTKLSGDEEVNMLILPQGSLVGSGRAFLIANDPENESRLAVEPDVVDTAVSLSNTKLLIKLYEPLGGGGRILVDAVDDGVGAPFAGSNEPPKASMERMDLSGSGRVKENWQTATTFLNFDDGAALFGTPGASNGTGPAEDVFPPKEAVGLSAEILSGSGAGSGSESLLLVSWVPSISLDLANQTLTYDRELLGGTGMTLPASASGVTFENVRNGTGIAFTLRSSDDRGNTSSGVSTVSTAFPKVMITEVLANPSGADEEEWIELGNLGNDAADIGGWILDDGNSPEAYAILSPFPLAPNEHRAFPKSLSGLPLGNKGESLTLKRGLKTMDSWTYGETAEEVSYGRDVEHPEVFRAFCVPTRGKPNEVIPPDPRIVIQSGETVGTNSISINLVAEVLTGSIAHAQCNWSFGDGLTSDSCNPPSHSFREIGTYTVHLTYTDFCGNVEERRLPITVNPPRDSEAPAESADGGSGSRGRGGGGGGGRSTCTPAVFSGIRISELVPNPEGKDDASFAADAAFRGSGGEWIELENTENSAASLCQWELDDSEGGSAPFFLDGISIPGNGFLLLPRERTGIAINNDTESVRLFSPKHTLVEEISFEESIEGESFARRDDGMFLWTPHPTPGEPNRFRPTRSRYSNARIAVSSAYPNPEGRDDGAEWIEIRNDERQSFDLSGWFLDNREGGSAPYALDGVILRPGETRRFTAEETGIILTNTQDEARLLDPDGFVIALLSWVRAASGRVYLPFRPGETDEATVLRTIDGDTIEVSIGGTRETVRLIGVDTPETVHPFKPVEALGAEAAAFMRETLEGETITLVYDEERFDTYGRLLAYVLLNDGTNVNAELIRRGFSPAYLRFPFALADLFAAYEAEARRAKVGLWADEEVVAAVVGKTTGGSEEGTLEGVKGESGSLTSASPAPPVPLTTSSLFLLLTEILPNPPLEGPLHDLGEYIELHNPTDAPILLSGWILDDDPEGSSKPQALTEDFAVAPHSYRVLSGSSLRVSLNNEGEALSLSSPDGSVVISVTYPELKRGQSFSYMKTSREWCASFIPTPNAKNICRSPSIAPQEHPSKRTTKKRRVEQTNLLTNAMPTTNPFAFLKTKYRNLTPEPARPAKIEERNGEFHHLLIALLPQIVNPDMPPLLTGAGTSKRARRPSPFPPTPLLITLLAFAFPITALTLTGRKQEQGSTQNRRSPV